MKKAITFVGLDVHSESITVAVLRHGSEEAVVETLANTAPAVRKAAQRWKGKGGEVRCCYEAGPCGFELHRLLSSLGIACEVIAPALIPRKPGDRIKTDRRDAVKLARLHRAGELTAIRVPTPDEEAVRDLVRVVDDIRKDLIAARHRLAKFLLRHGRMYLTGKKWTARFWAWLKTQSFERDCERAVFEHYKLQVLHLQERRDAIRKEIAAVAATEPYCDQVARLSCLRGISTEGAMTLLAEVQDFRRFPSPRPLMAFLGVVPSEWSSGGKESRGGITKTGNAHARRILVEAAWAYRHIESTPDRIRRLLTGQPAEVVAEVQKAQRRLCKRFRHLISHGKRSQLAVTAVARELCGFVWALMVKHAA